MHYPGGDSFRFFAVVATQVELEAVPGIKVGSYYSAFKEDQNTLFFSCYTFQAYIED